MNGIGVTGKFGMKTETGLQIGPSGLLEEACLKQRADAFCDVDIF